MGMCFKYGQDGTIPEQQNREIPAYYTFGMSSYTNMDAQSNQVSGNYLTTGYDIPASH
jgi:hypothetical protein